MSRTSKAIRYCHRSYGYPDAWEYSPLPGGTYILRNTSKGWEVSEESSAGVSDGNYSFHLTPIGSGFKTRLTAIEFIDAYIEGIARW